MGVEEAFGAGQEVDLIEGEELEGADLVGVASERDDMSPGELKMIAKKNREKFAIKKSYSIEVSNSSWGEVG